MSIEAMKLALEALEEIHHGNMTPMAETNWNKAITALRQAIDAADQDWILLEATQESLREHMIEIHRLRDALEQRSWQSLTDAEIAEGQKQSWVDKQAFESAVWWAEEKLREKNRG